MKQFYTSMLAILLFSCQKENITVQKSSSFSDSAFGYLHAVLSTEEFDKLDLSSFRYLKLKNENIGMRIPEKGNTNRFILLKKEQNRFSGNRISISGIRTNHNGEILLEPLDRSPSNKFVVENNKVVRLNARTLSYELPEVTVVAYRQSYQVEYFSLYWLFDQNPSYEYYYSNVDFQSGVGGGADNAEAAATAYSPDKPVTDVKSELKCFTNNPASTYTVTVNVNQPVPGTRDVIDPFAGFPVGHTFLTLQQNNADGSTIVRNVGFYPKNTVKPGTTTDVSTFGEDSETPFDVSLKINVSGSEFSTVINGLIYNQTKAYDLDMFNCTNSVINALKAINVRLPETQSKNPLFNGNNPADLGEDIKAMNLDKFSSESGGKKMVRNVSNSNSQTPPAKSGGC